MFEKVFYTFVENSIHHGEQVTDVRFSTAVKNSTLIITYEDNGIGIAQKDKQKIFDRLFGKHTGFGFLSQNKSLQLPI
jgi:signal transduction histidine kinase